MQGRAGLLVRAAVTVLAVSLLPSGILDTPLRLAGLRWPLWAAWLPPAGWTADGRQLLMPLQPGAWAAAAYAVFFVYGWGVFLHRDGVRASRRDSFWRAGSGILCAALAASAAKGRLQAWTLWHHGEGLLLMAVFSALGCWLVLDALAGPVLRWRSGTSAPSGRAGDAPSEPLCAICR